MTVSLNNVPWLPEQNVENRTMEILYEYGNRIGKTIVPPIPVEMIAEKLLGYHVELCTDGLFENPTLLGGIYFSEQVIKVNGAIEQQNGRFNFTIAHEIGHYMLHKHWLIGQRNQQNLFSTIVIPEILCRDEDTTKSRGEHQADMFAAYLVMPDRFVKSTFISLYGKNIDVSKQQSDITFPLLPNEYARQIAEEVIKKGNFINVSKIAMVNRLIGMDLITGVEYQKNDTFKNLVIEKEIPN